MHQIDNLHKAVAEDYCLMLILGSDIISEWVKNFIIGNNFSISITAETKKEADRFFSELSAGGNVTMPMDNTFRGDYLGMCIDKFGRNWMISYSETPQK